jgi:multisubunit Na+/H+ antiporter MnhG subunit
MKQKAKHTLITAEILGFFLIIIGVLAILTNRQVFMIAAYVLFFMIVVVAAIFATFMTLAVKEEKGTRGKKKK